MTAPEPISADPQWRYIVSCGDRVQGDAAARGYLAIHPGGGDRNASAQCGGEKWRYIGSCGDRVQGDATARGYRALHPGGGGGDGEEVMGAA